jgi:16S rRNA (uracil1498-N3)-methyltransferase
MIRLDESQSRHLRNVLRLKKGDSANVFDGLGREYECAVAEVKNKQAVLTIAGEVRVTSPESPLDLTLAAAILKGEKFDLVVQKAVELGVTRVIPLNTKRSDVRLKDPSKRVERWRKIALESAKQSGRATLMGINSPAAFVDLLSDPGLSAVGRILFSERNGGPLPEKLTTRALAAFVGPEGGWNDDELEAARLAGFTIVTLGGRIMRAETAAIAATTILQHRFGDIY